jgi:hypothetical protein
MVAFSSINGSQIIPQGWKLYNRTLIFHRFKVETWQLKLHNYPFD